MSWKIATFNVNGIRARLPLVLDWLGNHRPDVLCVQETKCRDQDFPTDPFRDMGYVVSYRGQKAFNGVAVFSRSEPQEVIKTFDDGFDSEQARFIAVRLDGIWIVNTYIPQGRDPDNPAFEYKLQFFAQLKRWFQGSFQPTDPLIWTGDINVAPEPIDVYDPQRLQGQVGFHPREREAFADVLSWGFTDLFRYCHPERKQFTFWDYRLRGGFKRNLGWRLDHILVTEPLLRRVVACDVDTDARSVPKPSDHTPVWAEFDLNG